MLTVKYLNRALKNSRGFSMIELMAVVIIIGMLAGFVGISVMKRLEKARLESTSVQISMLAGAFDTFKMDCGFYPSTEQGLEALIGAPSVGRTCKNYSSGGYLHAKGGKVSGVPKDPWGNFFNYREPGIQNADSFDLWSNGPDGLEGTPDDITNWGKASE